MEHQNEYFIIMHADGDSVGPLPLDQFEETIAQLIEVEEYKIKQQEQ